MALVNLETAINNLPVVVLAVDRERRIVPNHPLALALRCSDQQAEKKQRMGAISSLVPVQNGHPLSVLVAL